MHKSTFNIQKMDCPSEEHLVRLKLEPIDTVLSLQFDLGSRQVHVFHNGEVEPISNALGELLLDSMLQQTETISQNSLPSDAAAERKILSTVLLINFCLFVIEIIIGFIADSMGLVADSLDMLADAIVYSLSLYAIGKALSRKKRIAELSAYFQMLLAIFGMVEVIRRFAGFDELPDFKFMIFISLLALTGNLASLLILRKAQSKEAHIQASWIFTSNDVLVNIGVIIAGIMVFLTHSYLPDLIAGMVIFLIVLRGSFRILKLSK